MVSPQKPTEDLESVEWGLDSAVEQGDEWTGDLFPKATEECPGVPKAANDGILNSVPNSGDKSVDSVRSKTRASSTDKKKLPIPCMRPHECHICHRILSNRAVLRMHLHTHTGEKPYSCPFCPLRFTNSAGLYIHKRKHTGEKPFTCNVCGRKFSQWAGHQTHMTTHTGERPYKCSVCEKTFARRDTLQIHFRTHTGERPYQCSMCPKAYRQRISFQRHQLKHKNGR